VVLRRGGGKKVLKGHMLRGRNVEKNFSDHVIGKGVMKRV
jgi:hypothetical protein